AIDEMVAHGKRRSMLVTLCTNASTLDARLAESLVECGLDRLNVSLNAGTPETYPRIHVSETPENYRQVKRNLRRLADLKARSGARAPHVKLSYVVGARNFFELEQMVRVVHEVGAEEGMFVHTVVHSGTQDLRLDREQYDRLLDSVPRAKFLAAELGVETNLGTFAATVPTYLDDTVEGPAVVPCYVGWYFTVILGNGSVMPCCQCSEPVGRITETESFAEIWASSRYRGFRKAARNLPEKDDNLSSCECDRCMLRPRNISVHNTLHPWNRIHGGNREQLMTVGDLLRMKKKDRS
ncbi:MAG: radical SAM protein, partial [Acidobacteriota bacterium]|nr:radical SAM protein [Acidobacteriota bacterium]